MQATHPSLISKDARLIVALDFDSPSKAKELVKKLDNQVRWYKIGLELYTHPKVFDLIEWLKHQEKSLFIDLKLHDIPRTVAAAIHQLKGIASLASVHAQDASLLQAAADAAQGCIQLLGVTVLTSIDQKSLADQGHNISMSELVLKRARLAQNASLSGIVSSPLEANMIRKELGQDLLIVTPGIRIKSSQDDQKRIATPQFAIEQGANMIVVGRPITAADNPKAQCQTILNLLSYNDDPKATCQ